MNRTINGFFVISTVVFLVACAPKKQLSKNSPTVELTTDQKTTQPSGKTNTTQPVSIASSPTSPPNYPTPNISQPQTPNNLMPPPLPNLPVLLPPYLQNPPTVSQPLVPVVVQNLAVYSTIHRYTPSVQIYEQTKYIARAEYSPFRTILYNSTGIGELKFSLFAAPVPGCGIPVKQFYKTISTFNANGEKMNESYTHFVCGKDCPSSDYESQTKPAGFDSAWQIQTSIKLDGVLGYGCGDPIPGSVPLLVYNERCDNGKEFPAYRVSTSPLKSKCDYNDSEGATFLHKTAFVFPPRHEGFLLSEPGPSVCSDRVSPQSRIRDFYTRLLRREPSSLEVAGWVNSYGEWLTFGIQDSAMFVTFLTSAEYRNRAGSTGSWVAQLYKDVLRREGSPQEIQSWVTVQNAQTALYQSSWAAFPITPSEREVNLSYSKVAREFIDSTEYLTLVKSCY